MTLREIHVQIHVQTFPIRAYPEPRVVTKRVSISTAPDSLPGANVAIASQQLLALCTALSLHLLLSGEQRGSSPGRMCLAAQGHSILRAGTW